VVPFGRLAKMKRNDLVQAFKPEGAGKAAQFWHWCEQQVHEFL
jgi:hypothetical protein